MGWLLNGSHPRLEDGVVTREIYGSYYDQCSSYTSDPIQVKACAGNYYIYKFTRPTLLVPDPVYCTVSFTTPSIDPCYNYTSLDQPWRSTDNYYNYGKCDYNVEWNGWYRMFYNGQNTQMPESCVNQYMCGTYSPLWLNGPHPQLEDGVVTRQVCVSSGSGCCSYTSHPIRVKACPGNYYIYEFVRPQVCSVYCVESTSQSIPSASTTTETTTSVESITPPITTTGKANSTHFIYDNFILGTPRSEGEGLISKEKILKLSFSCANPQSQKLSINLEKNPRESQFFLKWILNLERILPAGEGRYRVRMIPFEDDEFTRPFTGRVNAELDQEMHVEVRVEGVDSRQFALVMDTCWATPVNDPDYSLRWNLILSECPNPNDGTVDLLQNGVSTSSRFSFGMFIFTANSTKLYLHCAVHLCLLSSNRCSMDCDSGHRRREVRSLDFHDSASISMGPLVLSEGNTDKWVPEQVKVSEASCLCGSLMLILVPLMSVLTHF
ncbi:pancreatic secretory granule membrane major glycoprotein GP2-like [Siphateles boraxobius]|uniref:pancreatic secretory granule membrane major glycoprotein GP2-like n=1 Tax=Siphateles boraxobius TaxID=180520 RepID=UPI004063335F